MRDFVWFFLANFSYLMSFHFLIPLTQSQGIKFIEWGVMMVKRRLLDQKLLRNIFKNLNFTLTIPPVLASWFSCQENSWIFETFCQNLGNYSWQGSQDFAWFFKILAKNREAKHWILGLTSLLLSATIKETPDWFSNVNKIFRWIQNW